mmetsp:Transcript_19177/g.76357  ORF Transcript_19177/g.76357 Transcript_19177/m.76357 type:complete len:254 (+) Transcript_19177:118-879(+)
MNERRPHPSPFFSSTRARRERFPRGVAAVRGLFELSAATAGRATGLLSDDICCCCTARLKLGVLGIVGRIRRVLRRRRRRRRRRHAGLLIDEIGEAVRVGPPVVRDDRGPVDGASHGGGGGRVEGDLGEVGLERVGREGDVEEREEPAQFRFGVAQQIFVGHDEGLVLRVAAEHDEPVVFEAPQRVESRVQSDGIVRPLAARVREVRREIRCHERVAVLAPHDDQLDLAREHGVRRADPPHIIGLRVDHNPYG